MGIPFSLFSFLFAFTFISLQMKEFGIIGLSINDSVYSSVLFFLIGLHFFHLLFGLLLLSLFFWGCSLLLKTFIFFDFKSSEINLLCHLQLFFLFFMSVFLESFRLFPFKSSRIQQKKRALTDSRE
jgi:hypothetical protein